MKDMRKLCEVIETELHKIAEKGLTTSNLDTAYKLIDMYKDLKNTNYWETKEEYYNTVLDEMQGGYSNADKYMMEDEYAMRSRKRDKMGRYASSEGIMHDRRNTRGHYTDEGMMHEKYLDAKQSYRNNKSMDGKQKLMESLENYMDDFAEKLKEMARDADFPEEKEMINKFLGKLQNIR